MPRHIKWLARKMFPVLGLIYIEPADVDRLIAENAERVEGGT